MALTQSHFRFGLDQLAESTHGWLGDEDANIVLSSGTTFLLRFTVQANATGLNNVDFEFQCRKNAGSWQNITTTSTIARAVAAVALTNGGDCTKRLSGTGTFVTNNDGQTEDGTTGGNNNDIASNGNSECECGLEIRAADVVKDDLIEFRLTRDGGVLLDTYSVTPGLTVSEAFSLTCDTASYAYTPAAATFDLKMPASAGSYAFTGNDATLTLGAAPKILAADAGSYAFTGNAADLDHIKRVPAEAGAYALTGNAATFDLKLPAATGDYALTGSAATFGLSMPGAAGSYALTGNDANPELGREVSAAAGAYAFTGGDASLVLDGDDPVLLADTGAYALTGNAASLELGREVAAAQGVYTYTPAAASLELGREVVGAQGSYALTGNAASLELGREVSADAGAYAFSGGATSLELGREVIGAAGAYALTVADANLVKLGSIVLAADPGAYVLTVAAAGLSQGVRRKSNVVRGWKRLPGWRGAFTRGNWA